MVYDTIELVDKIYSELDNLHDNKKEKLNIAQPIVVLENRKTFIANFRELCQTINRSEASIKQFIDDEFKETSSISENGALIIARTIPGAKSGIKKILNNYISKYIICSECKSIKTNICKESRITYLNCNNCLSKKAIEKS